MMAEFEADFLVLVFQVASELVEKLGLHFVQPFVDLVLTEVDTFDLDLDLTVLTEYSSTRKSASNSAIMDESRSNCEFWSGAISTTTTK
jgi:hypothetical protein